MRSTIQEGTFNMVLELTPEEVFDIMNDLDFLIDASNYSRNTRDMLLAIHGSAHAISYEMGRKNCRLT